MIIAKITTSLLSATFFDVLISAKNEALRDGKESAPYLTDENLSMAVLNLMVG